MPKRKASPEAQEGPQKKRSAAHQSYSATQKNAITTFVSLTNADRSTAAKYLRQHAWHVEQAVNGYFNVSAQTAPAASRTALNKVFDKFRDTASELDSISMVGTQRYLTAIDVSLEDVSALIAQEIIQSPGIGEMTREGFVNGWSALGCDTLDKQKALVRSRRLQLASPSAREILRNVYKHSFKLVLTQPNQKTINKETAVELWQLFFSPPSLSWRTAKHNWLESWVEYLNQSPTKGVNADVWDQTFKFVEEVLRDDTLSWWDEMASWPGIIDGFVAWLSVNKGIGKKKQVADEMEF